MRNKFAILSLVLIGGILMYTKIGWQPKPSTATMITADRLNHMDEGIYQAHVQMENIEKSTLRKTLNERQNMKLLRKYDLPTTFEFKPPVTIYYDGINFYTDYKKEKFKNASTKTYYVSPNGNNSNNGLSESAPVKSFSEAISRASNNDTIILLDGDYTRDNSVDGIVINKNLNIIGQGNVRVFMGNKLTYTKAAGYNYVYQATRSNVAKAIDISIKEGIELTEVSSLEECDQLEGSWYKNGNDFYVHAFDGGVPNNVIALLSVNSWIISNASQVINVYIENVNLYGGQAGTLSVNPESNNNTFVCLDNVGLYHGVGKGTNGNMLNGYTGTIILHKVVAMYGEKDGFNYAKTSLSSNSNYPKPQFIEIDCIGANNGLKNQTIGQDASNNGSTAHSGVQGIRINGKYYNNMGGNVADVEEGTKTVNLGCEAYDSACDYYSEKSTDFTAQQPGAEMWLDGCKSYNSKSNFNIYAISGTTMHLWNCMYDVITGLGTKDIINPL